MFTGLGSDFIAVMNYLSYIIFLKYLDSAYWTECVLPTTNLP